MLAPASSSRCGAVVAIYLRATHRTTIVVVEVVVVVVEKPVRMAAVKPIRPARVKYGSYEGHQRVVKQWLAPAVERGRPYAIGQQRLQMAA